MNMRTLISFSAPLALMLLVLPAYAEPPRPPLWDGMSLEEVAGAWGAPKEKIELESKREELWVYPDVKLRFVQGKLHQLPVGDNALDSGTVVGTKQTVPESPEGLAPPGVAVVQEILSEIMEGSSSGEPGGGGGAPPVIDALSVPTPR